MKAVSAGIRVLVTLHGFDSCAIRHLYSKFNGRVKFHCPGEYCSSKRVIYDSIHKLFWKILGSSVSAIITPSMSEKDNLVRCLQIPRTKIYVVHHGVDLDLYRPHSKDHSFAVLSQKYNINDDFILHVSSYQPKKNVEGIIAAYALLKRKFSIKERLIIVGSQPRDRLKRFSIKLGLNPRDVIFVGIVPEKDLVYFYSAARVFVFPSFHESFGMPILEAMASGCPVVTSKYFSCSEITDDAALLVNPFDINEIALAIHKLLRDEKLRVTLRHRGFKRAKFFSWKKAALKHLKIYYEIADT